MKLKIFGSFAAILFIIFTVPFIFTLKKSENNVSLTEEDAASASKETQSFKKDLKNEMKRRPASASPTKISKRPTFQRSENEVKDIDQSPPIYREDLPVEQNEPYYPEEHQVSENEFNNHQSDQENMEENFDEGRSPASLENSLVPRPRRKPRNLQDENSGLSVEDVMNGSEEPIVEEVSDF